MNEQSHKDEMRAALRGDFERMRARQENGAEAQPDEAQPDAVAAEQTADPVTDDPTERASWLDRLLGRD